MPFINTSGAKINYEISGEGEETMLFSHGLLFNKSMFAAQIEHFSKNYRCIAYDHRGQGQSESDGPFDMESLYGDCVALVEELNPGPIHFVGLSMGGFMGLRLAARRPDLVRSLVILESSAQTEAFKLKYNVLVQLVKLFGVSSVLGRVMPVMFGRKFLKDDARREQRQFWKKHLGALPKTIVGPVRGVIDRQGVEDELANIKSPTLILVGDQDKATPVPKSEFIARNIEGSLLQVLPGAGHSASIEEPEQVIKLMQEFYQRLPNALAS